MWIQINTKGYVNDEYGFQRQPVGFRPLLDGHTDAYRLVLDILPFYPENLPLLLIITPCLLPYLNYNLFSFLSIRKKTLKSDSAPPQKKPKNKKRTTTKNKQTCSHIFLSRVGGEEYGLHDYFGIHLSRLILVIISVFGECESLCTVSYIGKKRLYKNVSRYFHHLTWLLAKSEDGVIIKSHFLVFTVFLQDMALLQLIIAVGMLFGALSSLPACI